MNPTTIKLVIVLVLSWAVPIYGVLANQFAPRYETALGVPYAFFLGCLIHLVLLLAWVGIRRSTLQRKVVVALLVSFGLMIGLTILSNSGTLSRMG